MAIFSSSKKKALSLFPIAPKLYQARMRFSVFFLAALALIACASAALELRCSSGTLQGVGGALAGVFRTQAGVQRPVRKFCFSRKVGYRFSGAAFDDNDEVDGDAEEPTFDAFFALKSQSKTVRRPHLIVTVQFLK